MQHSGARLALGFFFFFQAEDGIRDKLVTGVQTCAIPIYLGWTWKEVSGRGTIYSYEVVHHAIQPGFKDATPYGVVLVELDEQRGQPTADEGLRIIGNLVKPDGVSFEDDTQVAIGKRVRVVFQDLAEHMALVQFALSDEAPPGRVWRLPE